MSLKKPSVHIAWIAVFLIYFAVLAWLYFATFESDSALPPALLGIPLDKCVHFLMFLPFPVLGTIAFCKDSWWRTLCWSTVAANIIAFVFESQQHNINPTLTKKKVFSRCANNRRFPFAKANFAKIFAI